MPNVLPTARKLNMLTSVYIATGTYKCALFNATFVTTTETYSVTNEITGTGYTAGGVTLTGVTTTTSGTTAFGDAADAVWGPGATFSGARYAVVYDTVNGPNRIVAIFDFGADQGGTNMTFTVQWPTPDATSAMLRVA